MLYVIIQSCPPGTPASRRKFWNCNEGWVGRPYADVFDGLEKADFNRPNDGRWVEAHAVLMPNCSYATRAK